MLLFLRALFVLVIVSMLAVTSWASFRCPLFAVPAETAMHPWFLATLADAYWGFLTFYVWVFYKQTTAVARGAWFVAILLLGNIAMAAYCLRELGRARDAAGLRGLLSSRNDGASPLGVALALTGAIAVGVAAAR